MKHLVFLIFFLNSVLVYSQWEQLNSNTSDNITDIVFTDSIQGFYVTNNGNIFKSVDGGQNWSNQYNNNSISFNYITFTNNKLHAFGTENGANLYFFSEDNGISWESEAFSSIIVSLQKLNNKIYYTNFSTTSLYLFNENNPSIIATNIGKFGVNNIFNEIIYTNSNYSIIQKSSDGGETWQQLINYPIDFGSNQSTDAVIKSFGDTILTHYTYPASTSYSFNNGESWSVTDLDVVGVGYCQVMKSTLILGFYQNDLYSLENFGSWQQQFSFNYSPRKIYFFNDTIGYVIGDNGMIYKTLNGGGLVDILESHLINDLIKLYPNPVKSKIYLITDPKVNIFKICIFDLNGKLIKSYKINDRSLNVKQIKSGEYILKIETDKGIKIDKIQIIH